VQQDQARGEIRSAPSLRGLVSRSGLSGKLLLLTVLFVMLAEVLIFVPSVANFRVNWLMQRLEAAQIASLAAEAAPDGRLPEMLRDELLMKAGVRGVALKRNDTRTLILAEDMPPEIDSHYDLRTATSLEKIIDAIAVFFARDGRIIRVMGKPDSASDTSIEVVMAEAPLQDATIRYGLNILFLSIIISLLAAMLIYAALDRILVRPMRRLTSSIMAFAEHPEDASRIISPSSRTDEIGTAEHELARMQRDLAGMLRQKSHLASLGLAVSKINHDLRNMLSNAQLISDRLGTVDDPTVQRVTPRLIASLDRAIRLCTETLKFGKTTEAPPERRRVALLPLVSGIGEDLGLPRPGRIEWAIAVPPGLEVDADPDQLYRILQNLAGNSVQVMETDSTRNGHTLSISASRDGAATVIEVTDTGPGVPAKARANLFVPFHGSARKGGTGLGLAIVAELVKAHGGTIDLVEHPSGAGAAFRLRIPDRAT
jgi:signal transduction histidine kinase